MKRTVSIALILLLLVSHLNIAMTTHYCCGKKVGSALTWGGETLDCGMSVTPAPSGCNPLEDNSSQIKKHCCANDHVQLKTARDYLSAVQKLVPAKIFITIPRSFQTILAQPNISTPKDFAFWTRPPPHLSRQAMLQTFLL